MVLYCQRVLNLETPHRVWISGSWRKQNSPIKQMCREARANQTNTSSKVALETPRLRDPVLRAAKSMVSREGLLPASAFGGLTCETDRFSARLGCSQNRPGHEAVINASKGRGFS